MLSDDDNNNQCETFNELRISNLNDSDVCTSSDSISSNPLVDIGIPNQTETNLTSIYFIYITLQKMLTVEINIIHTKCLYKY